MKENLNKRRSAKEEQQQLLGKRPFTKKRVCRFCADKNIKVDYKDVRAMRQFISERGKIVPRRINGNCAKHQREVTIAVKRARVLAIAPFTTAVV